MYIYIYKIMFLSTPCLQVTQSFRLRRRVVCDKWLLFSSLSLS